MMAQPRFMTLKQAGQVYSVSDRTLRRRIADGTLPAVRVGPRSIRVAAEDVEALASPIPTGSPAA